MKGKLVAVSYNEHGKCDEILEVKNLDTFEYKKHLNESREEKKTLELKLVELAKEVSEHEMCFSKNNFLLAKSIYDNFVDRGLIDDDVDFQKAFYDFIFEGKQITNCPKEFHTILMKVSGN